MTEYDVRACVRVMKRRVFLHSPGMSSMLEMPLSQISTSSRFLSRLSSTIFFKDLDILAGSGEQALTLTPSRERTRAWSSGVKPTFHRVENGKKPAEVQTLPADALADV